MTCFRYRFEPDFHLTLLLAATFAFFLKRESQKVSLSPLTLLQHRAGALDSTPLHLVSPAAAVPLVTTSTRGISPTSIGDRRCVPTSSLSFDPL